MKTAYSLKEKIIRRIGGSKGESLAEVLIALLISSLGLVLLAAMITSSGNMLTSSKAAMKEYVAAENRLAEQGSSSLEGSVVISSGGSSLKLTDASGSSIDVLYYLNDSNGLETVASYRADE